MIPQFTEMLPIEKGWSGDRKYRVTDADGGVYLLRLSPEKKYESKAAEFEFMKRVEALGVPMCRPVDFGRCGEDVYTVLEWIEGRDAEEAVAGMTDSEARRLGFAAGQYLRRIHTLPAPEDTEDWRSRYGRKIDRKLKLYAECSLKYENDRLLLDYIRDNRELIHDRPQTMHHGDYHVGNMMVTEGGELVIIDFDRFDHGDPWEEFNRVVWCVQSRPAFASAMVDGYFAAEGTVPEKFWRLMALYIAVNTLSSLPWAIPFGEGEVEVMRKQAAQVLEWYDGMSRIVPGWYDSL